MKKKINKKKSYIIIYKIIGYILFLTGYIMFLLSENTSIDIGVVGINKYKGINLIFGFSKYDETHLNFNVILFILFLLLFLGFIYLIISEFIKLKLFKKLNIYIPLLILAISISLLFTPKIVNLSLGTFYENNPMYAVFDSLSIKSLPIFTISIILIAISSLFFIFFELIKNDEITSNQNH